MKYLRACRIIVLSDRVNQDWMIRNHYFEPWIGDHKSIRHDAVKSREKSSVILLKSLNHFAQSLRVLWILSVNPDYFLQHPDLLECLAKLDLA